MKIRPSLRAATLAALFVAVQLAACGGSDDNDNGAPAPAPPAAPTTISPLKTLVYAMQRPDDGSAFSGAGQVSDPTTSGATLALGAAGSIVLSVDTGNNAFTITTPDYTVVNRFAGSVLMLCDVADAPGNGSARYVAVAQSVAEGGSAAEPVTGAAALAGLRFFKMAHCSYQSGAGPQGQNAAADAHTLWLEFDGAGNASSNASTATYSAAQVSDMLGNGSSVDGVRLSAWRFVVDGQPSIVLLERGAYDAASGTQGDLKLWLPR